MHKKIIFETSERNEWVIFWKKLTLEIIIFTGIYSTFYCAYSFVSLTIFWKIFNILEVVKLLEDQLLALLIFSSFQVVMKTLKI